MAGKQAQKTRTRVNQTKTQTAMTQRQSQEFVQTLLHSGLSTLTRLRSLFPEEHYDQRYISTSNRLSYDDYANARLPSDKKSAVAPHRSVPILRRGRSQRVDKVLDWLENGAFLALEEGKLVALQLYIHLDGKERNKVVESYTFTLNYHTTADGAAIAGLTMSGPGNQTITVENAYKGLATLLTNLIEVCQSSPILPAERFISLAIHLKGGTSSTLTGFVPCPSNELLFGQTDEWQKSTTVSKQMTAGFHDATLRVSHLRRAAFGGQNDGGQRLPAKLEYTVTGSKSDDIEELDDNNEPDRPDPTPSTVVETPAVDAIGRRAVTRQNVESQASNAPVMRNAFQNMLQPERLTQGDTQTQAHTSAGRKASMPAPHNAKKQVTLLPEVIKRLDKNKKTLTKIAKQKGKIDHRSGDVILCQCEHLVDEGEMLGCAFCDTWQHLRCYGYSCGEDPRLSPELHACYQCLLHGDEQAMKTMNDLALKRRALSIGLRKGLKRKGEFSTDMGITSKIGGDMQDYFLKQGFIQPTTMSHKPGFAKSGAPYYVPATDAAVFDRMVPEMFNPLEHLEAYYYPLDDRDARQVAQQLQGLAASNMPAAATPKSGKKAQKTATRDASSPPSSPAPPPAPQTARKRTRQEDEAEFAASTPAAKRTPLYQRLQTMQSEFLLFADGKPTPPGQRPRPLR